MAVERFGPCSWLYSRMRLYMGDMEYPFSMLRQLFGLASWCVASAAVEVVDGDSTDVIFEEEGVGWGVAFVVLNLGI